MTTSGVFSFTCNRDQIIRDAMLNIGALDEIENPTSSETSDCAFKLNMLIKQWMGKADFAPGLKVWTRRRAALFLNNAGYKYSVGPTATGWAETYVRPMTTAAANAAATAIVVSAATGIAAGYNIAVQLSTGALQWTTVLSVVGLTVNLNAALTSPVNSGAQIYAYQATAQQPLRIEAAVLRDNTNSDTPLGLMVQAQYDSLPNKTDPTNNGDPSSIYYEFQRGNSLLFTDVGAAQDVTKYIVATYLEPVQDMTTAADEFEYPQEWFLALSWGLAEQICPMFSATWTQLMAKNAGNALRIAQNKDAERVMDYFQPGAD